MTGLYYELSGLYQTENCLTILAALDILKNLGYEICNKDYYTGFSNVCEMTGLMGRWQKLKAILTSSVTQATTLMALKVFASN